MAARALPAAINCPRCFPSRNINGAFTRARLCTRIYIVLITSSRDEYFAGGRGEANANVPQIFVSSVLSNAPRGRERCIFARIFRAEKTPDINRGELRAIPFYDRVSSHEPHFGGEVSGSRDYFQTASRYKATSFFFSPSLIMMQRVLALLL